MCGSVGVSRSGVIASTAGVRGQRGAAGPISHDSGEKAGLMVLSMLVLSMCLPQPTTSWFCSAFGAVAAFSGECDTLTILLQRKDPVTETCHTIRTATRIGPLTTCGVSITFRRCYNTTLTAERSQIAGLFYRRLFLIKPLRCKIAARSCSQRMQRTARTWRSRCSTLA